MSGASFVCIYVALFLSPNQCTRHQQQSCHPYFLHPPGQYLGHQPARGGGERGMGETAASATSILLHKLNIILTHILASFVPQAIHCFLENLVFDVLQLSLLYLPQKQAQQAHWVIWLESATETSTVNQMPGVCHRNKHSESNDWSCTHSTRKAAWAVKFCFSVTMTWHWSNGWCWGQTN